MTAGLQYNPGGRMQYAPTPTSNPRAYAIGPYDVIMNIAYRNTFVNEVFRELHIPAGWGRDYRISIIPPTISRVPIILERVICSPRKTMEAIMAIRGYEPAMGTTREASMDLSAWK